MLIRAKNPDYLLVWAFVLFDVRGRLRLAMTALHALDHFGFQLPIQSQGVLLLTVWTHGSGDKTPTFIHLQHPILDDADFHFASRARKYHPVRAALL